MSTLNASARKSSAAKSSKAAKGRKADFPAVAPLTPEPKMFAPKPLDPAAVRRNARVRLVDGREGIVTATGAIRIRIQPAEGASYVVERSKVEAVTAEAVAAKRTATKGAPKALKIAGDAPVSVIAEALIAWAGQVTPERVLAAVKIVAEKLSV